MSLRPRAIIHTHACMHAPTVARRRSAAHQRLRELVQDDLEVGGEVRRRHEGSPAEHDVAIDRPPRHAVIRERLRPEAGACDLQRRHAAGALGGRQGPHGDDDVRVKHCMAPHEFTPPALCAALTSLLSWCTWLAA